MATTMTTDRNKAGEKRKCTATDNKNDDNESKRPRKLRRRQKVLPDKNRLKSMDDGLLLLENPNVTVTLLKILHCNAEHPKSFTKVYCDYISNTDESQYKHIEVPDDDDDDEYDDDDDDEYDDDDNDDDHDDYNNNDGNGGHNVNDEQGQGEARESSSLKTKKKTKYVLDMNDETYKKQSLLTPFILLFDFPLLRNVFKSGKYGCNTSSYQQKAIIKLYDFMDDAKIDQIGELLHAFASSSCNETTWCIIVAVHLLKYLSVAQSLLLDSRMNSRLDYCPCRNVKCVYKKHKLKLPYGDTTIGHCDVWHGNVDILLGSQFATGVAVEDIVLDSVSEFEEPSKKKTTLDYEHFIAQDIAFAYCVKKQNDKIKEQEVEYKPVTLIPNIVITKSKVKIFMYDYDQDFLLYCKELPLFDNEGCGNRLQESTIVALWLALNYKHFCTGLTDDIIDTDYHSCFMSHIESEGGEKIREIYNSQMKVRCGFHRTGDAKPDFFKRAAKRTMIPPRNYYDSS